LDGRDTVGCQSVSDHSQEVSCATSDEYLQKPWSLLAAGSSVFTQLRYLVYRTFFLNHLVHHRAQLGVLLRLNGIAVPAVYNDSADEQGGMFMEPQLSAAGSGSR
jgi:uncharacterized damage-inducible protein DinB